jgi:O-antigen/teichoic acid export membrane protein
LISLSGEIISIWINPEFSKNAYFVLQIIAVGGLYNFLARIPLSIIQGSGRPDISAKFHLLELPIYLVILYVLTLNYGIYGAAIATSLRMILDFFLLHIYAARNLNVGYKFFHLVAGSIIPILVGFVFSSINQSIVIKLLIVIAFCVFLTVIYWAYIFDKKLKSFVKTIIRDRLKLYRL